jgi:hypothetical protein
MYTAPSLDDLLAGLQIALQDELMPYLSNTKAVATAAMMQSVLQELRQVLPVYDQYLVEEHNAMLEVLHEAAEALGDTPGAAADAVRARSAANASRPWLAPPPRRSTLTDAHRELSAALVDTVVDLDVLQRGGDPRADEALALIRAHLGPRLVRDAATLVAGIGMVGRG